MVKNFNDFINVNDELKIFKEYLVDKYNIELSIHYSNISDILILSKIIVNKNDRGLGIGSNVMKEICDYCDEKNLKIALTPSSDFGGSKNRLIIFYKKFDFKPYKGYEFQETMVRYPK